MGFEFARNFFGAGKNLNKVHSDETLTIPDIIEPMEINEAVSPIATDAAPIHVVTGETLLKIDAGLLRIETKSGDVITRPIEQVSSVQLYGGGAVTNAVVTELSKLGRSVIWRSHSGYPLSTSTNMSPAGYDLRLKQYELVNNPKWRTAAARNIVSAKIQNMRGLLRRRKVLSSGEGIADHQLKRYTAKAQKCRETDILLGIEGAATRQYFQVLPELLKRRASAEDFNGRSRQPPSDIANAAMSYLYAVLLGECVCALTACGLDPRCGILHKPRAGKPALGLDLMEPFRSSIVDACVTSAMNAGALSKQHTKIRSGGVFLTDDGKRKAIAAIERKYSTSIKREAQENSFIWRDQVHRDAIRLADAIRKETVFLPFVYA